MQNNSEKDIINYLKKHLKKTRFIHSINVMNMAVRLAESHNVNADDARIAGLLHDCAKNMTNEELLEYCNKNDIPVDNIKLGSPGMLHADVGADIAKKQFNANDAVYQAIAYHTLANRNMTDLDKILYISDLIEEGRDLEGLGPIREMAFKNLDKALIMALEYCIDNVKSRGKIIHEQSNEALCEAKKKLER